MRFQYPLKASFKIIALAPQIFVRDANGQSLMYVKQKLLKLKENVGVFADESKSQQLFTIGADRIIDFSAQYHFTSHYTNQRFGSVKRKGMRSLWSANYMIFDGMGNQTHELHEANPWVKVADGCFGQIPFLGILSGYVFHPEYIINPVGSTEPVMRVKKQPAFFEGVFSIEALNPMISDEDEARFLLSFLMMLLLERQRG